MHWKIESKPEIFCKKRLNRMSLKNFTLQYLTAEQRIAEDLGAHFTFGKSEYMLTMITVRVFVCFIGA